MKLFDDVGFGKVDMMREKLKGFPEIIYGEYKTAEHILEIAKSLIEEHDRVLITKLAENKWFEIKNELPHGIYDKEAEIYSYGQCNQMKKGSLVVLSAGTADYFVTQEAYLTGRWMGANVSCIQDIGVAGLARLLSYVDEIRQASVVIVIAGMEGALPSVVSGLIDTPLIAVPTSVGYGANLNGITTMLAMLTSCSSGISVVNIDNGFGAAYQAALIIRLLNKEEHGL